MLLACLGALGQDVAPQDQGIGGLAQTLRQRASPYRVLHIVAHPDGGNRMHEVPNVFVVDGSVFPTASEKNPTLTIGSPRSATGRPCRPDRIPAARL